MKSLVKRLQWAASTAPAPGRDGWLFQLGACGPDAAVWTKRSLFWTFRQTTERAPCRTVAPAEPGKTLASLRGAPAISDQAIALHRKSWWNGIWRWREAGEETLKNGNCGWPAWQFSRRMAGRTERRRCRWTAADQKKPRRISRGFISIGAQRYARSELWNRIKEALSLLNQSLPLGLAKTIWRRSELTGNIRMDPRVS